MYCTWFLLIFCISVLDDVNLFTCEEMSGWLLFLGHGKGNIRLGHPRTIRGISRKKIFCFTVMMLVGSCEDPNRREIILYEANPMPGVFQNIDPPPPHRPASVYAFGAGGGHTRYRWRGGWGVNILEDARHCSVLHIQYVSTRCVRKLMRRAS